MEDELETELETHLETAEVLEAERVGDSEFARAYVSGTFNEGEFEKSELIQEVQDITPTRYDGVSCAEVALIML